MRSDRPALLAIALFFLAAGCRSFPLGAPGPEGDSSDPVPSREPLAAGVQELFTPRHPGWGLRLELVEADDDHDRFRFEFQTFSEVYDDFRTVSGDYYRTRRAAPAPLVLDSPILGGAKDGYLADRVFAGWAAREGMSTVFLHQEADILTGDRDALELERLLRDNVLAYRKALDLFLARTDEVDPRRLGSFGISLGGVKNVILIAAEPRLRANVLCLAGGDLPRILLESRERMVLRYLRRREARDGLCPEEVAAEIARDVICEPLHLARSIAPERVLLFLGTLDDKVPYSTGLALRQALGRPELRTFPLGHYTGLLAAPHAARKGFEWMRQRFREAVGDPAPPPGSPPRGPESLERDA